MRITVRVVRKLLAVAVIGSVVACSGGPVGPGSSEPVPPTVAGSFSEHGCSRTHFHLMRTAVAARKARRLVARMSLNQEVTLMHGAGLNGGTAGTVGSTAPIPSLGIPAINQQDGPGGVGDFDSGVTQLPAPIALAATFDPSAARCYGQVIGTEARAKGIELMYGPTVNLVRAPQWGRAFESLGEDPQLAGTMAAAEIAGTQHAGVMAEAKHFAVYNQETYRNTPADNAIVAPRTLQEIYLKVWRSVVAAHPAAIMCAYSTINGQPACQNRPLLRGYLDHELHFGGFVGADFNGTHSTVASARAGLDQEQPSERYFGHRLVAAIAAGRVPRRFVDEAAVRILTQIYRFRLFTDYPPAAPRKVVTNLADAAVARRVAEQSTVLLKNTDKVLPLTGSGSIAVIGPAATSATAGGGTATVLSPGTVTPLRGLQSGAPRGARVSYTAGLPAIEQLHPIPAADVSPAFPADGLTRAYHATLTAPESGTYVFGLKPGLVYTPVSLSIDGTPLLTDPDSPPLRNYTAAIHLRAGQTYRLAVSDGASGLVWATPSQVEPQIQAAANAAAHVSCAVVVVADGQESEAADRASLALPSAQDDLVRSVAAANPHTVVVVEAGAAVAMPWLADVSAVVDQWYAGQAAGTALAAVLFGAVNPSGHLPVTFPASLSQVPASQPRQFPGVAGKAHYTEGVDVGYRWWIDTHHTPLFPFGFGLSYTSFRYHRPIVKVAAGRRGPVVSVRAVVTNEGSRDGADVAQVYLGSPAVGEPARQLEGYRRVSVQVGKSVTVSFQLSGLQLASFSHGRWRIPAGRYRVYVGDSSASAQLTTSLAFRLRRSYLL